MGVWNIALEDVVLENAFFELAVREDHFAVAVLYAVDPGPVVGASVSPRHDALTVPLVVEVLAHVPVTRFPDVNSFAFPLVVAVISFVSV